MKNLTSNQQPATSNQKGFTLVELLVVIGIIAVLSALLLSNMQDARARARDTQRKNDLKQLQKALEMYKQDNNEYPETASWTTDLYNPPAAKYMGGTPQDPLNTNPYTYHYAKDDQYEYTLVACLENASDPDADSSKDTNCSSAKASFTLTEP